MQNPRYSVYRLEVFEPEYTVTAQNSITGDAMSFKIGGGQLLADVVIPELEELRRHVYDAMLNGFPTLYVTYLGDRNLITTCAQFDSIYVR